jgi:methylated-DNA-[protein]-cysteine S-methyltransferase
MTASDLLEDRLRAGAAPPLPDLGPAAAAAGLLDVAYTVEDSPVGRLLLAGTDAGLVRVAYLDTHDEATVLAVLAARISPRVLAAPARLDAARRELEEWFAGRRAEVTLAVDRRLMSAFARRVLGATAAIPYGETSTYAAVAAAIGSPRGARAAGNALGSNPLPIVVPCHRVLTSGGALGGYTGGTQRKLALLAIEGRDETR